MRWVLTIFIKAINFDPLQATIEKFVQNKFIVKKYFGKRKKFGDKKMYFIESSTTFSAPELPNRNVDEEPLSECPVPGCSKFIFSQLYKLKLSKPNVTQLNSTQSNSKATRVEVRHS